MTRVNIWINVFLLLFFIYFVFYIPIITKSTGKNLRETQI